MALYHYPELFLCFLDEKRNQLALRLIKNRLVEKLVKQRLLTPNGLTMFRLVVTVVLTTHVLTGYWLTRALNFLGESKWFIFGLFLVGSLSDAIDGPLSRHYRSLFSEEDRRYGINFDRHIDKVFTGALLLIYWPAYDPITKWVIVALIVGDLLATGLAILANKIGNPAKPNSLGKAKMVFQCIGIGTLILRLSPLATQFLMVAAFTLGMASLVTNIRRFPRTSK